MNNSLQAISLSGILWAFAPTLIVLAILYGWKLNLKATLHAITRRLDLSPWRA